MTKTVYPYSKLFGTSSIESKTELMFAHAVGRILNMTGEALDLSGVHYNNLSNLTDSDKDYFKSCATEGGVVGYIDNSTGIRYTDNFMELDPFKQDKLFGEGEDGGLIWNPRIAKHIMSTHITTISYKRLPYTILMLVAKHYVDVVLRGETRTLTLDFDSLESGTYVNYTSILFMRSRLELLARHLKVDIFASPVDLSYRMLVHSANNLGRNREHDTDEKVESANAQGIVPGQICVLWTRMITSSRSGDEVSLNRNSKAFSDRRLVRFEGFETRGNRPVAKFLVMGEPYTHEELVGQFSYFNDSKTARRYSDILTQPIGHRYEYLELHNLAFGDYIYDEHHFVTRLDPRATVTKPVTVDDGYDSPKIVKMTMLEVDAIYWVMKQRDFYFDEELYNQSNYTPDREPLYEEMSYEANNEGWYLPGNLDGLTVRKPRARGVKYGLPE